MLQIEKEADWSKEMRAYASKELPKWISIMEYFEDEHREESFLRKKVSRSFKKIRRSI